MNNRDNQNISNISCTNKDFEHFLEKLVSCSKQDLTKTLMDIFEKRSDKVSIKGIFNEYEFSRFPKISTKNIKHLHNIENFIINYDSNREFVRLSPVTPFGLIHFLNNTSQKRLLTTIRGNDITSDGSIALALEAAKRRKGATKKDIQLASFLTCLRSQSFHGSNNFEKKPKAHFQVMANCYAGRSQAGYGFEKKYSYELLYKYCSLIRELKKIGYINFKSFEIMLSDMNFLPSFFHAVTNTQSVTSAENEAHKFRQYQLQYRTKHGLNEEPQLGKIFSINHELISGDVLKLKSFLNDYQINFDIEYLEKMYLHIKNLEKDFSDIGLSVKIDLGRTWGTGHYSGLAFSGFLTNKTGVRSDVFDGGTVNRGKKLLSDYKEKMIVGGFGTDLLANLYNV